MQVWFVQVTLTDQFEDLYVNARNETEAKRIALKRTRLQHRFANAIV